MTVSIMDGHTGKDHVTSDDWAAFNASTYGNQGAVLGSGSFKLTMETSTKGTLSAGLGIVQGRRFRVTDSETVAFDACGAGMKRSDIVVARYSNADGIESVSIAVVKGKENATSAVSPQVQNGDLPLWNVVFDGVNVYKGFPARVTAPTQSIASAASADSVDALKNSVDALKKSLEKSLEINNMDVFVDTDSDGNAIDVHAAKVGGIVIVSGSSTGMFEIPSDNEWHAVTTLVSGWRPKRTEHAAGSSYTGDGIAVSIGTDGVISLACGGSESVSYWKFNAVFAI